MNAGNCIKQAPNKPEAPAFRPFGAYIYINPARVIHGSGVSLNLCMVCTSHMR